MVVSIVSVYLDLVWLVGGVTVSRVSSFSSGMHGLPCLAWW